MDLERCFISFTMKSKLLVKETIFSKTKAVYRLQGLLRLEGSSLRLEWSGTKKLLTSSFVNLVRTEIIPLTHLNLPIDALKEIEVHGWLWPRIEIEVLHLEKLTSFPSPHLGKIVLQCHRKDWKTIRYFVAHLQLEMVNHSLQTDRPLALPSTSI